MINKEVILKKIENYQSYLEADPENCHLLITLGDSQHQAGLFSDAKQSFTQCLQIEPDNKIAKGRLANILISQSRFDEAIHEFQELLEAQPGNPELKHNIALCHFYQYQFDKAKNIFSELLDTQSCNRSSRFHLASIEHIQGSLGKAIGMLKKLIEEQADDYIEGYLAIVEYAANKIESSLARAQQVLKNNPANIDAAAVLAMHNSENQEIQQAGKYFDIMIEHSPYDARGWHGKGLLAMQEDKHDKAIENLQKAVDLLPKNAGMRATLGWAYITQNNFTQAEKVFNDALALDQNFAESHGGLAIALIMQNKKAEAEKATRTAERLDKNSFSAIYARSLLKHAAGDKQQAIELLGNMLDQAPLPGRPKLIEHINKSLKKKNIDISAFANRGNNHEQ